jgi:hypothetical protein
MIECLPFVHMLDGSYMHYIKYSSSFVQSCMHACTHAKRLTCAHQLMQMSIRCIILPIQMVKARRDTHMTKHIHAQLDVLLACHVVYHI